MRYHELILPIAADELRLTFHPELTVLAGLDATQRAEFIDTFVELVRGSVPGGSITLVDAAGRRHRIDVGSESGTSRRSAGDWRSLLCVGAEDLGMPRAGDDLGPTGQLTELRNRAEDLRTEIAAAEEVRRRRTLVLGELEACEAELTRIGGDAGRTRPSRARTLVELERHRETLAALDAPPRQQRRDAELIEAAERIQHLAAQWAEVGERSDHLRSEFGGRERLDTAHLAKSIDIPDSIPESLRAAIADHDRLRDRHNEESAALEQLLDVPAPEMPDDDRVLTLATVDQETLWLTHRDVIMATEALREAQRHEAERVAVDPAEQQRTEDAHERARATEETAQRRWLPSVLGATTTASIAALFLVGDMWVDAVLPLLGASLLILLVGVGVPRFRSRRARRAERLALEEVEAVDIEEYRARFAEHPDSDYFKRAEQIIENFEAADNEWRTLVGTISPAEATELEAQVHDWTARTDPARTTREAERLRRRIAETDHEISEVARRLTTMLRPFGVDPRTLMLPTVLASRVAVGHTARLQVALTDAEESEAKFTRLLDTELTTLGFEAGSLATKIAAYGRAADAARQRDRLRCEAPDRADLAARIERLNIRLSVPAPVDPSPRHEPDERTRVRIRALTARRDELASQVTDPVTADVDLLRRRLTRIEERIAGVEASLDDIEELAVAGSIDHLVETLVRYRPVWPTTETEPAPAILDDPFAAVPSDLKTQLLDALVEVSGVAQMVVLTDDEDTVTWARAAQQEGTATLIAPT